MEKQGKGKVIQSVQRAIDILNCFDEADIELSLQEISGKLGINKSTVHGILNTLHINRYIQQNDNGQYMLGQALFNKSTYAIHATKSRFRTLSKSYMTKISNKYKCSSHVFSVEGSKLHFLDMSTPINSYYIISTFLNDLMHLYCTASGKLLLSHMSLFDRNEYLDNLRFISYTDKTMTSKEAIVKNIEQILECGYSLENEEVEEGCISIAVPVFTKHGDLFGTISITGSKIRVVGKELDIVNDLKEASAKITTHLF